MRTVLRRNFYRKLKAYFVLLSRLRLDTIPHGRVPSTTAVPQITYVSRAADPVAGSSGPPGWKIFVITVEYVGGVPSEETISPYDVDHFSFSQTSSTV